MHLLHRRFSALFFFVFIATTAFAQTAEVRGFVYNEKNGEPIIFNNVFLQGTGYGAQTDVNGYFSITKIAAGTYTLVTTAIGFDTVRMQVSLKAGEIKTQKLFLHERSLELKTVEISSRKTEKVTTVNAAIEKVSPREINVLPSIGGEPDLAQYLQTIPGVVFTGDQGGQLYIRGGTPVQTLVLLDGMIVYNPFHSIGLFSVFDTDILRNVDVYTGGFSAEYGGRVSAVMDVKTRDGNRKRTGGEISVNPFTSKVLLEGPIGKRTEGISNSSFLFSARSSYLEQSSKLFYEYANEDGLPFNFTDVYGKVSINSEGGNRLSFSGFNFNDRVKIGDNSEVNWNSYGAGTDIILLPSAASMMMHLAFGFSNYDIEITEETSRPRNSSINGFNLGLDFTYFIERNELNYGLNVIGNRTDFIGYTPLGVQQRETQNNTELAAFVKYNIVKNRYVLQPSVRFHYYASLGQISPEPRLAFKLNITDRIRFKAAAGLFTQNFISTRSDRDVVNLFAGFLSSPEVLQDADNNRIENRLQRSQHLITGFEFDLTDNLELNVEPYLKNFSQLTNVNRSQLFATDSKYIVEEGLAKGVDFALKYDKKDLMLQAGYSLATVDRKFGDLEYKTNFDRRHNVNLLGTYTFGPEKSFEVSARWNLGSGFPFTPTQGFYERSLLGSIDQDFVTENGDLGILYGDINSKRLPYYHRLDISAKKTYKLSENSTLEVNAGVVNVYNRKNIFYFDRVSSQRVDQLPIIPSVGLSWKF